MHKTYLITYFLLISLAGLIPATANFLFLKNTKEFLPYQDIIRQQTNEQGVCLYGSALFDDIVPYKMQGYKKTKPNIAAIGSSRVLPFRASYFLDSFYNMGYTINCLSKGKEVVDQMLNAHKPQVVIMGIEIWWFLKDYCNASYQFSHLSAPAPNAEHLMLPFKWLAQEKISPSLYFNTILSQQPSCHSGVTAITMKNGYAKDGSRYAVGLVSGEQQEIGDTQFSHTIRRIKHPQGDRFMRAQKIDMGKFDLFLQIMETFKKNEVEVVLFFPPMANKIIATMDLYGTGYDYIDDLKSHLHQHHIAFYDFHDPRSIQSTDCEFTEGFHGGDIVYARILKHIYEDPSAKGKALGPHINYEKLDEVISKYKGLALAPEPQLTNKPEVDFLKLGCPK
jgi:hypothetical protein